MKCNCGDLRSILHVWTHDLDGHVTVQIHLPLLTATLVLQREPGIVVVVWANIVIAAETIIEYANTLNELLVLEILEKLSSHRLHTVPNGIVSSTRNEKTTTTRHRDVNTPAAGAMNSNTGAGATYSNTGAGAA